MSPRVRSFVAVLAVLAGLAPMSAVCQERQLGSAPVVVRNWDPWAYYGTGPLGGLGGLGGLGSKGGSSGGPSR